MQKRNIRLLLSYDGSRFFGWQKTAAGPSVQEEVEKALAQLLGETASLEAASRTDRGVHARGQSAHFFTQSPIDPHRLQGGLNALLPKEISIQAVEEMPFAFHPTLDATGKEYRYFICNAPVQSPIQRLFSWHLHQPLDIEEMKQAACHLLGEHDFSALSNERTEDAKRRLTRLDIVPLEKGRYRFDICGNSFLYKMARNIAGALAYAGLKKIRADALPQILSSKERKLAPMTAPAHGLFLWNVSYPQQAAS